MTKKSSQSPELVLIPGLGGDASLWEDQLHALSPVIATRATEAHFEAGSIASMAAAILAEGEAPMIVCGMSMGGFVALEMIRQAPSRIVGIALMGTSASADSPETSAVRLNIIATIERDGYEAFIAAGWKRAVHSSRRDDRALGARIVGANRRVGASRYVRQLRAIIARTDASAVLPSISCPVTVACGDGDMLMPADHARALAADIRGAELRIIERCGHIANVERPARVSSILGDLVARIHGRQR